MSQNVTKIVALFVVGMIGGIFGSQILWPLLVERSIFYQYDLAQLPQPIIKREEIIIRENLALQQAIAKVSRTIVAVQAKTATGRVIEGNGLMLTSDGLMVTLASLVPQGSQFLFSWQGKSQSFQILKRDLANNLALVKLRLNNAPITAFRTEPLELGERIFLVGIVNSGQEQVKTVNQGIVSAFSGNKPHYSNIIKSQNMSGSPVFDIAGQVVGLTLIDSKGSVDILPVDKIRSFAGL